MSINNKFQIGQTVEAGHGEDHDTGKVIDNDSSHNPHGYDAVQVAWGSGIRVWTPTQDLRAVK